MENTTKEYSQEEIIALTSAFQGDKKALQWLFDSHLRELAALYEVVAKNEEEAFDWLHRFHFKMLEAFICALKDDKKALDYLMDSGNKQWAATVCAIKGDDAALKWLDKYSFPHFALLANVLIDLSKSGGGNSFSGAGGGSGGGGFSGFGGFGGGSFGGGGAGGHW